MDQSKYSKMLSEVSKDNRFAHILQNPVYRRVPKREKKVEIDKRFKSMFYDKAFKLKYHMDKRGRPIDTTSNENLKRLYNLTSDEESEEEEQVEKDVEKEKEKKKTKKEKLLELKKSKSKNLKATSKSKIVQERVKDSATSSSEDEGEKEDSKGQAKKEKIKGHFEKPEMKAKVSLTKADRKKLHSAEIDYTRGEGVFADEGSSDDSTSCDEDLEQEVMQEWGEMDKDAPRTEEATTRLALCNMDWDRLSAEDLMVLFSSFLPAGGVLKQVSIYPSEFGKERLAEEELNGPKELVDEPLGSSEEEEEEDDDEEGAKNGDEDEEGSGYNMEKLRAYQLKRLKYYYGVLEFGSKEAADKVYTECDGMEYESSATRVDLRFVPEDMTFDDEPKDKCDALPNVQKYRPRFFVTTALQQVKVDLTWDETDPKRKELIEKIYDPKEKIDDEDIKAYLASSSSESDGENGAEDVEDEDDKKDPMLRYKALLQSIDDNERKKKDKDVEMEITWGVGLKSKSEELVKKKLEKEEAAKMTPWEEMLAKRREKRKTRKADAKKSTKEDSDKDSDEKDEDDVVVGNSEDDSESDSEIGESDDDEPFSDDNVDYDMNDPFFKEELSTNEIFKQSKNKNKNKLEKEKFGNKKKGETSKEDKKNEAELELLLMDEEQDTRKHFSLKKIMDAESTSTSKKKRNKKKMKKSEKNPPVEDDFQIDLKDDRFSALYTSHHYNVDPSYPGYKKTKGMEDIITEKQKRRHGQNEEQKNSLRPDIPWPKEITTTEKSEESTEIPAKKSKSELSYLVKSIKGKTQNMLSKKQNSNTNYKKFKGMQK